MKCNEITCAVEVAALGLVFVCLAMAESTIDPTHPYAYGANIGWVNMRADGTNGAAIGQYFCTGYMWSADCGWMKVGSGTPANGHSYANNLATDWGINHDGRGRLRGYAYGANIGWIDLGDGSPDNGMNYGNTSATDYGINHDGEGVLSGYAYGANIGWLCFEQTYGRPRVDLRSGNLDGYVWSANTGWISLSNAQAVVRTETLDSGPDVDDDTIPDAWEYGHTNSLAVLTNGLHDADGDGASDVAEYEADTDPFDAEDALRIISLSADGSTNHLAWTARPTRLYRIVATNRLTGAAGDWADAGPGLLGPLVSGTATQALDAVHAVEFYGVQAFIPPGVPE